MEHILTTAAMGNSSITTTAEAGWKFDGPVQRRLVGGLLVIIGAAGLVGNAVVIIAFVLSKKLQNITNIFVVNLAVSDFLSCLLVPFFVQNVLTEIEKLLPKPVCAMVGILLYVFVSSSIVNHAVIAINRYCSISRPDAIYRKIFSPLRVAVMLVFIWTYSSVIPLVAHLSGIIEFGFNSKYRICSLDVAQPRALKVSIVRAVFVDVVCLIIVTIFYVKFFLFVRGHSNQLMHIYSHDRQRASEDSSNAESLNIRSDMSQATGMTNQTSTITRIVDLDDPNGIETVLSRPGHRKAWRPMMGRSVSQAVTTLTEAGGVSLSAIDESAEYIKDDKASSDDDEGIGDNKRTENSKVEICEKGKHTREHDVGRDVEHIISTSAIRGINSRDNLDYDVGHVSSREDGAMEANEEDEVFHKRDSDTPFNLDGETYRQERTQSSVSLTPSAIVRFSELAKRSFFGRNSSVSSESERIRSMQDRLNERQVQITKNLVVVVCAFAVCVSQYAVFLATPSLERLLPYSAVLLLVSHAINPVIYAIKHPTFKVVIRPMLMCRLSKIPEPSKFLRTMLRR